MLKRDKEEEGDRSILNVLRHHPLPGYFLADFAKFCVRSHRGRRKQPSPLTPCLSPSLMFETDKQKSKDEMADELL